MARFKFLVSENDVKKLVKTWYDVRGAWSYAPIQRGMGEHGIPDRVGCVPIVVTPEMVGTTVGLFVAVEAKKPGRRGEKLSGAKPAQADKLKEIADAGGVSMLVDGTHDLDILSALLNLLRQGKQVTKDVLTRRLGNG